MLPVYLVGLLHLKCPICPWPTLGHGNYPLTPGKILPHSGPAFIRQLLVPAKWKALSYNPVWPGIVHLHHPSCFHFISRAKVSEVHSTGTQCPLVLKMEASIFAATRISQYPPRSSSTKCDAYSFWQLINSLVDPPYRKHRCGQSFRMYS